MTVAQAPGADAAGPGDSGPPEDGASTDADNSRPGGEGQRPPPPATALISPAVTFKAQEPRGENNYPLALEGGQTIGVDMFAGFNFAIPARVVAITLGTREPGNALTLAPPATADPKIACRPGVTAEPTRDLSYLCTLGIRMAESARAGPLYEGIVEMSFEATCTSKIGKPCESLSDHYDPSPSNPVTVRFSCEYYATFGKKG